VIHLIGPVVLAAALAGTGVYGLIARRNAVLVLIGAELILNAANVLLVTAGSLPAGGLVALTGPQLYGGNGTVGTAAADPLLSGQVMTVFVITIAAAEIGLALAVILLLYRRRETSDLAAVRELGEASATYTIPADAGEWPADAASLAAVTSASEEVL
jgi:NADH-quinone oxidoreductase subunit K